MRFTLSTLVVACLLATIRSDLDAGSMCCDSDWNLLEQGGCIVNNSTHVKSMRLRCPNGHYSIELGEDHNGTVEVDAQENLVLRHDRVLTKGQFCIGRLSQQDNGVHIANRKRVALVCFGDYTAADIKMFVIGLLTLISAVFLFMTLAVYLTLPQLRDLQGKCTMCVCLSLALGFLSLAMSNLAQTDNQMMCSASGFTIYFWMISTFLWMNVVSINVWRSVALTRSQEKESTQFVWYSAYAWGVAVALLLITVITDYVEVSHLRPRIKAECWFVGRTETWLYFYGPIAVLLLCNIALFVLTSIKLWKLNKDYDNALNMRNLKFKFLMYLKLFLVMGISWIFEIASFAHGNEDAVIWYITDAFNCLQGFLFFFVLVVCRKKAMRGLAERGLLGPFSAAARRHYAATDDEESDDNVDDTEAPMSLQTSTNCY